MARRRRRQGCSLRPLGCLALLFLCGLCTTSTFFGGRAAEDRGCISEFDVPSLPDVELSDIDRLPFVVTLEEGEVGTPEPSPTALPREGATKLHRRIMNTRIDTGSFFSGGLLAGAEGYMELEQGVTLYFTMGENGLSHVYFDRDDDGRNEETWIFEDRSFWGGQEIRRTVWPDDEERSISTEWRWTGGDWELVP